MIYNIKMIMEFDGENFAGWQIQKNNPSEFRSIQNILENILKEIYGRGVKLQGSSRLDAKVNALGFCANYLAPFFIPSENLRLAINSKILKLSEKIKIKNLKYVEALNFKFKDLNILNKKNLFHARYSAKGKLYIYKICNIEKEKRSLFLKNMLFLDKVLDKKTIEYLKVFVKNFLGEHDFNGFSISEKTKKNTVCFINYIGIKSFQNYRYIYILIKGNRFLHKMIRFIVGAILDLGYGKIAEKEILENLNLAKKIHNIRVVEGNNLFLKKVYY